jgi:hypothetical protein
MDAGTGADCSLMKVTTAFKFSVTSTWPGTSAVIAEPAPTAPASEMGAPLNIWLLAKYDVDGSNKVTGTWKTCGNQTPPVVLTDLAANATGVPKGSKVQIITPTSVWDAITKTTAFTGTVGGTKGGSSLSVDPSVTLTGMKDSSSLHDPTMVWPCWQMTPMQCPNEVPQMQMSMGPIIPTSDLSDDDGDGKPGITVNASTAMGFIVPRVALSTTAPMADKLYVVLRTALSLNGTFSQDCQTGKGTANVNLINNHVIGCDLSGTDCVASQYNFIDQNTTQYVSASATVAWKQMGAGAVTCSDVLAAVP